MFSKQYNGLLKQRVHFSCSGFPSNATLFWIFYSIITATCFGRMTIFRRKYSGSGFPSNATLFWIFYSIITATCFGRMTIFRRKYLLLLLLLLNKIFKTVLR
jgi:hypothetical protein